MTNSIPGSLKSFSAKSRLFDFGIKKLVLLFAISAVCTVLYFPSLTFLGFSYKPGDVAIMDVKSPVEITGLDVTIKKGEIVIRDGQIVTDADIRKFDLVEAAIKERRSILSVAGFFGLTAVLLSMSYLFAGWNIRKFSTHPKDLLLMGVVFVGVLFLIRVSEAAGIVLKEIFPAPPSFYKYIIPVAIGPMLVRLILNSETALVFAAITSIMVGYFTGGSLEMAAYALIGSAVGAMGVRHCTHRSIVIKAGIILGAANIVTLLSIAAIKGGASLAEPFYIILAGLVNGLITAILAVGIAPVLEIAFQYTTNIRLLELSRMDHPLLKELAMRAPGTHHHSIVIGTLAEAAAESINANPLLARVAAYYHDIGKLKMPAYFIENISGENRHDKLTPSMSSLILTNHIKEGVDLAKKYRVGQEITDIISQHHGTSLITYFYQKAKSQEEPQVHEIDESEFRYPGPKPQTKEAGLVMLADAIEAASKTIPDPNPDKIQWLTQKIVNKFFTDGQLDECELTLKDLHSITKSFNRVFAGIYHQRIDYPEPAYIKEKELEGAGAGRNKDEKGLTDKEDSRERLKRLGI
ncbi:MAG: HDIG domain-containing protein [Deltaproteobacteria bacterium]|nr:HDIG domain-containing protein [Deltaproteobacteria bacterium]